jgi:hypothetical protein
MSWIHSAPDVSHAAKEGQPTMTDPKRTIPASIPLPAGATESAQNTGAPAGSSTEVSAQTLNGSSSALDTKSDARSPLNGPAPSTDQNANAPLPQNRDKERARIAKQIAKKNARLQKKAKKNADQQAPANGNANGTGDPNPNTTPASNTQTVPSAANSAAPKNGAPPVPAQ